MADAEEADRRARRGEHQHQCSRCSRWYWGDHKAEHEREFAHAALPSGIEVNHFGNLVRTLRRKHPCVDCAAAQADYEEMVATSDRLVASFKPATEPTA